jgi:hypothetical protein
MPPEVTCPACGHRFEVPPGTETAFACPRCGAEFPRTAVRAAQRDIQSGPSAPAVLPTTVCPSCGKEVPGLCLLCPHCEEPLRERHRLRGAGEGGWRVLRPFRPWWVLPLATIGAIAILLSGVAAADGGLAGGQGIAQGLFGFVVGVVILVVASAAAVLASPWPRSGRGSRGRFVAGLAVVGCVVVVGFAVAFAALLFLGLVCSVLG